MKTVCILLATFIYAGSAQGADFTPTMLKLTADPVIAYDFSGSTIHMPIRVSGTSAGVIFCLFNRGWADETGPLTNGYLGWHYVNDIDTCMYCSPMYNFDPGDHTIPWDGNDQDGNPVPRGEYTYYFWGFDNRGEKQLMTEHMYAGPGFDMTTAVQERDESGLPLANPIWYRADERWYIGSAPNDSTRNIITDISDVLHNRWVTLGEPLIDQYDFSYCYIMVADREKKIASICKYKFVPGGRAEVQTEWGIDGYAETFDTAGGGSAGVVTDGDYLYTTDDNSVSSSKPDADFYIYDFAGFMVDRIDLTSWWSSSDDYDKGGQMNGGPDNMYARNGRIFLNGSMSCLIRMIDPRRYLESGDYHDFFVWSNGNGDYMFDRNFEETAQHPWVCNDYNVPPYKNSISADANMFSVSNAYDLGAVSFGLLAPDGTGLGYYAYAGDTAARKNGTIIIDGNTPFDGLYCDKPPSGVIYHDDSDGDDKIYFVGHDSIKGRMLQFYDCFGESPEITVTSPNGGETLITGQQFDITWSMSGGCIPLHLRVEYSADSGKTWNLIVTYAKTSEHKLAWHIPEMESPSCLIRLRDSSSSTGRVFDTSDKNFTITGDVQADNAEPKTFSLSPNHPNPFNPVTTIPFTLGTESHVSLTVFDVAGRKVDTLVDSVLPAGAHEAIWDASDFASGVYIYRLKGLNFEKTGKMTFVK